MTTNAKGKTESNRDTAYSSDKPANFNKKYITTNDIDTRKLEPKDKSYPKSESSRDAESRNETIKLTPNPSIK